MRKTKMDDGFYPYLVDGAALVGAPGIPALMDLHNTQIPRKLIPFEKILQVRDKRGYVHFYMHDQYFERVLTSTTKYVDLLKQFDGVITPDCTLERGQAPCLQQTNTYFNRAVGYYLQRQGIPVIPNVRWSDESSFEYCFLGQHRAKEVVGRQMNFSSDAIVSFEGLLEVSQEICKQQMAEKTLPDVPPICAVLP